MMMQMQITKGITFFQNRRISYYRCALPFFLQRGVAVAYSRILQYSFFSFGVQSAEDEKKLFFFRIGRILSDAMRRIVYGIIDQVIKAHLKADTQLFKCREFCISVAFFVKGINGRIRYS